MKNILTILALVFTLFASAQKIEYPRYVVDSTGQKVVQMTISQAMKLDNNTELLGLFEELGVEMGSFDRVYIKVISDKDVVISKQKVEIRNLKENTDIKSKEIVVLQNESFAYVKKIVLLEDQLGIKKEETGILNKQIVKLKTKMVVGGLVGGAIITGLTYLLLVR
jgi:hypothetical protein